MSIEIGIWKMDKEAIRIPSRTLENEDELQELIFRDPSLISDDLLILGQYVRTAHGKEIDLLGINSDGELVVIELKRDKTPRDVVAQTLDYATWVSQLGYDDIVEIFNKYKHSDDSFEFAFEDAFKHAPMKDLNETHLLVVVASELDDSTERIVLYLGESFGVPINVVFFTCFEDGGNRYLTRTWLKDPMEVETTSATSIEKSKKELVERDILRLEFWTGLLGFSKEKTKLFANISPGHYHYIQTSSGKSGLNFIYTVKEEEGTAELYIDRGKESLEENKKIFDDLYVNKDKIEESFGAPLIWDKIEGRRACRIKKKIEGGYRSNKERWPDIQRNMINEMINLHKVLKPIIDRLDI